MQGLLRRKLVQRVQCLNDQRTKKDQVKKETEHQTECYQVADRSLFASMHWKKLVEETNERKALHSLYGLGFEDFVARTLQCRQDCGLDLLPLLQVTHYFSCTPSFRLEKKSFEQRQHARVAVGSNWTCYLAICCRRKIGGDE
jgi:hypothetical protein